MKLRLMLLAGAMLAPALANAQSYGRIISFGDSLSDNGNLFSLTGNPPVPYFNGRFSNGLTWAELLNGPMIAAGPTILGFPPAPGTLPASANLNFAFGGARTDALVAVPPGTVTQIGNYLGLGGTFRATDMVTLWAGANDLFQQFPISAATPATAQATMGATATTAATNVGAQVGMLAGAGARTIVTLNLPDLGKAPSFLAQGAQAVQLASFASVTFNTTWQAATAAAAAANPAANVIQVPVDQLFNAVIASPGAFGFANVTSQCLLTPACVGGTAATQAGYLFWDGVHPTAAGHRVLANYVTEYVFAPMRTAAYGALADVGFWSRRQGAADVMDRLALVNPAAGKPEFFVGVIGESGERDIATVSGGFAGGSGTVYTAPLSGARYSAAGLRFGGFARLAPEWTAGLAFSATVGQAKAGNVKFTPVAFAGDLAARWQSGPTFVNLGLGGQVNLYGDIERSTLVGPLTNTAKTTGISASAVAEAGYRFDMGALGIIPKARLAYVVSQSAAFSEMGIVAPVSLSARTVDGVAAGGELRFEGRLGANMLAHALVGYESFLYSSAGRLTGRLINNTAQPFSTRMADPVGAGLLLGAGLDATFDGWKAGAAYRASIGEHKQVTHRGHVSISKAF